VVTSKIPLNASKEKSRNPFIYKGKRNYLPWHCLYLRRDPHGLLYWGFWGAFESTWLFSAIECTW